MAVATYADWLARLTSPRERLIGLKNTPGGSGYTSRPYSTFTVFTGVPAPGAIPTTAAVPARDILGALAQQNGGGTALRIAGIKWSSLMVGASTTISGGGTWMLCDRLSHQGGLSGIVTTPQTTNLPTAALTRYTDGVGVMCCLEIYTQIGSTGTTVTASYTNQAGTAGQVTPSVLFGTSAFGSQSRMIMLPSAAGDTGFRSVESVTVLATTGTAGNFGVTLFKPLLYISFGHLDVLNPAEPVLGTLAGGYPEILADACLYWIFIPSATSALANTPATFDILFAED